MTLRPSVPRAVVLALAFMLGVAGCHARRGEDNGGVPGDVDSSKPFTAIAEGDVLHVLGTEPFWGGTVKASTMTYTTPANPDGVEIAVRRFGGRNGLGLSGTLEGRALDMTVTPGRCSDGMSDHDFPYTVTLKLGEEVREGCGWTDANRFTQAKVP